LRKEPLFEVLVEKRLKGAYYLKKRSEYFLMRAVMKEQLIMLHQQNFPVLTICRIEACYTSAARKQEIVLEEKEAEL